VRLSLNPGHRVTASKELLSGAAVVSSHPPASRSCNAGRPPTTVCIQYIPESHDPPQLVNIGTSHNRQDFELVHAHVL